MTVMAGNMLFLTSVGRRIVTASVRVGHGPPLVPTPDEVVLSTPRRVGPGSSYGWNGT